jgi:hypothetical protein
MKAEELADAICRIDTLTEYQRELIAKAAAELRRLAALEQAAEPVKCQPSDFCMAQHVKLYTHPAPRKPMTREDMRKLTKEHFDNEELTGADFSLIRAVERFHKIEE